MYFAVRRDKAANGQRTQVGLRVFKQRIDILKMINTDLAVANYKEYPLWVVSCFILTMPVQLFAAIPAAPVMTLYRFNGDLNTPYYALESVLKGRKSVSGTLSQGTSIIPCLVIRNGRPVTDSSGTPFVGFEIVVDSRIATPLSTDRFKNAVERQKALRVQNHHCDPSVKNVIDVRKLFILKKPPFFDSSKPGQLNQTVPENESQSQLDEIIRAFHSSSDCQESNRKLIGRRTALNRAWNLFIQANLSRWPKSQLERAKHLDYTLRTAIYESHLDRGCNAYGACERNIIALSIRNRGKESCSGYQGCRFPGDYQGVSSKVSQYNIWDEYLTQITGLTSCFLNPHLGNPYYDKIRKMYKQNVSDVERILYGSDSDLGSIFESLPLGHLKSLRHYYHAPAMGKCFPDYPKVEYMSGAVARNGSDHALIANKRIQVDKKTAEGFLFREFILKEEMYHDTITIVDNYPGFIVDGRKVSLKQPKGCTPYGIPRGCRFDQVNRYRKTPPWLHAGKPFELRCTIQDFGENCLGNGTPTIVSVGGSCDTQMRPVRNVP